MVIIMSDKTLIPKTTLRARHTHKIRIGEWYSRESGPLVCFDNCMYSAKDTSPASRRADLRFTDNDADATTTQQWAWGPNSDSLLSSDQPGYSPLWRIPDSVFGNFWYNNHGYSNSEDQYWVSAKPAGYPTYGRDPLSGVHDLFPANSLSGDKPEHVSMFCSDTVTEQFPRLRDRGVSIHNPGLIQKYGSITPYTHWVKATKWTKSNKRRDYNVFPFQWVYDWAITDTAWLRVDILGLESSLVSAVENTALVGLDFATNGSNAKYGSISDTLFSQYKPVLDEHLVTAQDRATRGVMDVWVSLIEARKTVKLLADFKRLYIKQLSLIAAGAPFGKPTKKQLARLLAQKWLEGRYGWRQLIFDSQGIARLFASFFKKMRKSYSAGNFQPKWISSGFSQDLTVGVGHITIRYAGYGRLRAGVSTDPNLSDNWLKKLYQNCGEVNPFSISWELTKLSWVLDWFWDFGALIRVVSTDPARYIRAWHTISMPYETGYFFINGEIAHTDIRGAVLTAHEVAGTSKDTCSVFLNELFQDGEEVLYLSPALSGKAQIYFRDPRDPSRLPLVLPKGIMIRDYSQIADLLSLLVIFRR